MRWRIWLGLTLSLAACRETVLLDEGPFDGSVGGVDGAPTNCGAPVSFTPPSPKVMVALDRSDGMYARYGDSTPFAVARNALDQYSALYKNAIWFGYLDFPGTFCMGTQMCCPGTFVSPTGDVNSFSQALHTCDRTSNPPCGSPTGYQRPMAAALYSCSMFVFPPQSDMVQRYIVLITNGRPDCGSTGPGPCGDGEETHGVISQLSQGPRYVRTYVVAPGQSSSDQCLPDLAAAGGTGDSRSNDLTTDIGNILHTIATDVCEIKVDNPIGDSGRVGLYYRTTQQVPHDRNVGWEVSSSGYTIFLHDKWCDRLIDEGKNAFTLYTSCPEPPRQ